MAVTSDPKSNKLIIRFRVKGFEKQFYLSTGLKDNIANRAIVESRWELIQREISLGVFDSSLEKYKFGSKNKISKKTDVTLLELWTRFTEYKKHYLAQTTIETHYSKTERTILKIPHSINEPSKIRDYLLNTTTQQQTYRYLQDFKMCCSWGVECGLIDKNYFLDITITKPKKTSNQDDFRAYTLDERDLIITSFENHRLHSHYSPLIKFLFLTGCRPGEAFALTWGDISVDCRKISINKSRNVARVLKGTKNNKRRVFPVSENSKLYDLLTSMHRLGDYELVFLSKQGKKLLSDHLDYCWRGNNTPTGFIPGVVSELVGRRELSRYLKPYSTRHTFATWAIASGASPAHVANWIGDEVETVLRYYCHPNVITDDCPDF